MRIFTLGFLSTLFLIFAFSNANAQCYGPVGQMTAQPYKLQGQCYIYIQWAIPNSNVSIANANGYVAQGAASANGSANIAYDCSKGPITGVLSLHPDGRSCTQVQFAQEVILPVKFESITVDAVTGGALLKWSTSYEFNNAKYLIEKSTDGRVFSAIGEVPGAINSIELNKYSFTDATYKAGDASFYRLKQVDIDGASTYSKVVYINSGKSGAQSIRLAPNPFLNEDIQLVGASASEMNKNNIRVFSMSGKQISFEISGANAIRLDPSLPKGVYFVNISGTSHKLLKN